MLINQKNLAVYLNIDERTIRRYVKNHLLPKPILKGRESLRSIKQVEKYLQKIFQTKNRSYILIQIRKKNSSGNLSRLSNANIVQSL